MTVETNLIVLAACFTASGWLLARWWRSPGSEPGWRRNLGLTGLAFGGLSAVLLEFFYLHIWAYHALPFHGLALWIYSLVGLAGSAVGILLGLTAAGYLRLSAVLVSSIALFGWLRDFATGGAGAQVVNVSTLVVIALLGFAILKRLSAERHSANL